MGKVAATAAVTAILTVVVTSAFWIWFYNFVPQSPAQVARSGNVVAVKPEKAPPVEIAQQVVVGPAGLALPVVGITADQLVDTYDAARGAGRLAGRARARRWSSSRPPRQSCCSPVRRC